MTDDVNGGELLLLKIDDIPLTAEVICLALSTESSERINRPNRSQRVRLKA